MMMQQLDYRPIRRQLLFLFVVTLILFGGSVTCALLPTPTPVGILAPSPTTVEMPAPPTTMPVTPTPKVGTEAGPTPTGETLDIPLGIGLYNSDNVAFFNRYAREHDAVFARPPNMDLLNDVKIGQKTLLFAPRDEPLTDVETVISKAKAIGATILGYNVETVLIPEEIVRKEMELQQYAAENDLLYAFGPLLVKLERHYDDFARYADVIVLQSQRYQTTEEYEERVEELIEKIKSVNPEVKVWVQVSVNPPKKRHVTPDEVISDIQLIADKADLIVIYYAPKTAPVMEEVFKRLRQR